MQLYLQACYERCVSKILLVCIILLIIVQKKIRYVNIIRKNIVLEFFFVKKRNTDKFINKHKYCVQTPSFGSSGWSIRGNYGSVKSRKEIRGNEKYTHTYTRTQKRKYSDHLFFSIWQFFSTHFQTSTPSSPSLCLYEYFIYCFFISQSYTVSIYTVETYYIPTTIHRIIQRPTSYRRVYVSHEFIFTRTH